MSKILSLEIGNLDGLVVILFLIMFGPALIFLICGFILKSKKNKKAAKIFFILAGVYLIISLGICGGLLG